MKQGQCLVSARNSIARAMERSMSADARSALSAAIQTLDVGLGKKRRVIGGVDPNTLRGLMPTWRDIYCRRSIPNSAIADGAEFKFFHTGRDNDRADLGYASGVSIDEKYTNLEKDGRLPQGEVGLVYGVSFSFAHALLIADLPNWEQMRVILRERNGKTGLELGTMREFPSPYERRWNFQDDDAAPARDNIHMAGAARIFEEPLAVIRGNIEKSDQTQIVLKSAADSFTPAAIVVEARMHCLWFQHHGQLN